MSSHTGSHNNNVYMDKIHCSDQPLDCSFHPTKHNILVAALVDGTVEVHDILRPRKDGEDNNGGDNDVDKNDSDDEDDTLLASLTLCDASHSKPSSTSQKTNMAVKTAQFTSDGSTIVASTATGRLFGLDAERSIQFTTSQTPSVLWSIDDMMSTTSNSVTSRNDVGEVDSGSPASKAFKMKPTNGHHPIVVVHPFGIEGGGDSEDNSGGHHSQLFATGDDAGCVRIWDRRLCSGGGNSTDTSSSSSIRQPTGCIRHWHQHDDYVSGIDFAPRYDTNTFVTSSADGRLGVYDMRMSTDDNSKSNGAVGGSTGKNSGNNKRANGLSVDANFRLSDDQEDELLSVKIIKNGTKVVCGTGLGVLEVFSWGTWGDCSDRFPGHPASVDALLKIDESCILTGSSDGVMRVVQIQPDKLLGVVGDDHNGFPIEKLHFNANRHVVGSVSHDSYIRLWDARILLDDDDDGDDDDDDDDDENDDEGQKLPAVSTNNTGKKQLWSKQNESGDSEDEWEDMDPNDEEKDDSDDDSDDDDDSEDDEDSDDGGGGRGGGRKRLKTDNEKFFEDL